MASWPGGRGEASGPRQSGYWDGKAAGHLYAGCLQRRPRPLDCLSNGGLDQPALVAAGGHGGPAAAHRLPHLSSGAR